MRIDKKTPSTINVFIFKKYKLSKFIVEENEGVNVVRSLNDNQTKTDEKRNKIKSLRKIEIFWSLLTVFFPSEDSIHWQTVAWVEEA